MILCKKASVLVVVFCVGFAMTVEAARVNMHLVRSAAMDKNIPVTVILPDSYDGVKRYPVVYLLHGAGGSHSTNTWKGMQELIDRYDVILVSPDGAETSWWFDSPVDPKMRYETFAAKEVVAWTDETFRIDLDEPAGIVWKTTNDELSTHVIVTHDAKAAKARVVIRPFCTGPAVVNLYRVKAGDVIDGRAADVSVRIR